MKRFLPLGIATVGLAGLLAAPAVAYDGTANGPEVLWLDSFVPKRVFDWHFPRHRHHGKRPRTHLDLRHWFNPDLSPPVYTRHRLARGRWYLATVQGTYSHYTPALWHEATVGTDLGFGKLVLCGITEPLPEFPSTSTSTTGPVGMDAETVFGWPQVLATHQRRWRHSHKHRLRKTCSELPTHTTALEIDPGVHWGWWRKFRRHHFPRFETFAYRSPLEGAQSTPRPDHTYRYAIDGSGHPAGFALVDFPFFDNNGMLKITVAPALPSDCASFQWRQFVDRQRKPAFDSQTDCEQALAGN